MKVKKLVLLSSLLLGLVPLSRAQIAGTAHDFRHGMEAAYNPSGEVCIVCHAPHKTDAVQVPLWNHVTTTQVFVPYTGYNTHFTAGQPDGVSKLCLSCHDGVTAVNAYGSSGALQDTMTTARTLTMGAISARSNLTTNLSTTHPVSFVYTQALAGNTGLNDTSATSHLGHSIGQDMLDKNGKVQCTSCHEVHGTAYWKYQRMSNVGSALCLTCHKK